MSAEELAAARAEMADEQGEEAVGVANDSIPGYIRRWNRVVAAWTELEAEGLEAEVLWGTAARDAAEELKKCAGEMNGTLTLYLSELGGGPMSNRSAEIHEKMFARMGNPDEDEFEQKLVRAASRFEEFIRPHLRK